MEDKTFHDDFVLPSGRSQMTTEEWMAPLDREIEKLEEMLEETGKLLGLPPLDYPDWESSKSR